MRRIACTSICCWLLAATTGAAPIVSGTVSARDGTPLKDVQVQVEIRSVQNTAPTDENGHFQFDAATLFSIGELRDAAGLMLIFSKSGFEPANKMVRVGTAQVPGPVVVRLDATGGSAAIDPAEKQTLDRYAAAPGSAPLFLIPYSLVGITSADPKTVNEMLRANLERVIVTHLQASATGASPTVSLRLLPIEGVSDIDRMRAYGSHLNALGVITGYGAVEAAAGGAPTLGVSSTFLIIPRVGSVGAPVLYVDDAMPADGVTSPRLYQHLSKLWGRSAVLALGVSEFGKAQASGDEKALNRIRQYLQAERAGAGPGDEALVSQVNGLIAAVDQELAK